MLYLIVLLAVLLALAAGCALGVRALYRRGQ